MILTLDEAWIYRMKALFEPEKLSEAYQSSAPIRCGTSVFNRFSREAGSLGKDALERLSPYLLRPGEPGSVFEGDGDDEENGRSFSASPAEAADRPSRYIFSAKCTRAPVTVWSGPKNAAKVRRARDLVDSHDMYNRFKSLMGKEPSQDGGAPGNSTNPDDRLDIFLVPMDAPAGGVCGFCRAMSLGKKVSPSVNHALKGKFDEYFRAFALVTMDLPPFDGIYPTSEKLEIRPLHREEFRLLHEPGEQAVEIPLPPLSAKYVRIDNDLFDPAFVRLDLSDFLKKPDTLSVQAVIDDGEKLPPLDLTGKKELDFEVNREEKSPPDFKKMILVFSSTDRKSTTFNTLKIQVRGAKFLGTVHYGKNHHWGTENTNKNGSASSTGTLAENAVLHITLRYSNTYQGRDYYKPEDASGTYSYSYREHGEIRGHDQPGVGTIDRTADDSGALKRERIPCLLIHDPEKGSYSFDFSFSTPVKESGTEIWQGGVLTVPLRWALQVDERKYEGKTDGRFFSGSWSVPGKNFAPGTFSLAGHSGAHASWSFVKP